MTRAAECGWCDNTGNAQDMVENDELGLVHTECAAVLPGPDGTDDSDTAYEIGLDTLLGVG